MKHILSYIFTFFNTNRPLLFVSSILLAWATGMWVLASDDQTVNFYLQDFALIFTYIIATIFFIMMFEKDITLSVVAKIFSWIIIIGGIFDVIENVLSILFITGNLPSNNLIDYFTMLKKVGFLSAAYCAFLVLKLLVYVIRNFRKVYESIHVAPAGYLLKSLKIYLAGLITVIFSYFIFIKITIGQDIIVQITEYWGPFIWSLICIPLWAILCWYSARLVGYEKMLQPGSEIPEGFHLHIPRLIAFNALVSIQAAIIALPTIGNLTEGGVWAFIILQNLLYYFWHKINTSSPKPYGYVGVSSIIATAYITAMIYLVFIGNDFRHQRLLPVGALLLFTFQMMLARRFINRRKSIGGNPDGMMSVSFIGPSNLSKWIRVPENVRDKEQPLFRKMFLVAIAALLIFILANVFSYIADHMSALPLVLLGLTVIVMMANISTILSIHKGINAFVIVIIWVFILGKMYDPYKVRTVPVDPAKIKRPILKDYVRNWIDKRKCMIDSVDTFPVYLVIANGGASRSGYWVASVLSKLEENSNTNNDGNTFSSHLMVLAGASGGSLGNAAFYTLLKEDSVCDKPNTSNYLAQSREFLKQDFISPVIAHWLGADMANHLLPFHFDDRAAALEKSMEFHGQEPMHGAFAKPFTDVMDTSGRLPIFFINTTNVQQGQPAVISTIDIGTFSKRIDVLDSAAKSHPDKTSDIRLSTAVVLGARFPYVSPAGNLGKSSYVDGGYFDNTGAGILHEMLQELKPMLNKDSLGFEPELFRKLKFQLVHISNTSLETTPPKPMHPLINDLSAPIVTVLGTYGSQTTVNNFRLLNFMKEFSPGVESVEINLYKDKEEQAFPLNWVISDYNLERMDNNLEIQTGKVKLLPIQRRNNQHCNCISK